MASKSVANSSSSAKKIGRPERTIPVSESAIFDLVLATQQAEAAIVNLYRARCAFLNDANARKPRRAA